MQKRTIYSLLLTSLVLVFAFSTALAQDVTFQSKTVLRCQSGTMNITVNTPEALSGLEIVFEVTGEFASFSVDWDAVNFADPVLPDRTIIYDGNVVRMYALEGTAGDCLAAGATVVAQITFESADVCDGSIVVNGTEVAAPAPIPVVAVTQFTACDDASLIEATVTAGTVTIANAAPVIAGMLDATLHFGQTYTGTATASDNDLDAIPGGCEGLTFNKIAPSPAAMNVTAGGAITWVTTYADVCEHTVTIEVVDECGDADTTDFVICVQNDPPTITCPADIDIVLGETAEIGRAHV